MSLCPYFDCSDSDEYKEEIKPGELDNWESSSEKSSNKHSGEEADGEESGVENLGLEVDGNKSDSGKSAVTDFFGFSDSNGSSDLEAGEE
ncbi:hypothetical protein IQ07DRAFT_639602 [Pyrenochaeta sp. DS3sAY3a]|nr:hypothetical protein IQ07DRAFT_639602 [Pyrenochaeta sp. DS3sAY3a]